MHRTIFALTAALAAGPALGEETPYEEDCRQGACSRSYIGDYDWSGPAIHVLIRTVMTYQDSEIEDDEWIWAAAVNCADPATKFHGPVIVDDEFIPLNRNPPYSEEFRLNLWKAICENLSDFPPYQ